MKPNVLERSSSPLTPAPLREYHSRVLAYIAVAATITAGIFAKYFGYEILWMIPYALLYPHLAQMELVDYKVRILEGRHGTRSTTRVLISTSDGKAEWSTVGVGENVIAASWQALDDAYTYGLIRAGAEPQD